MELLASLSFKNPFFIGIIMRSNQFSLHPFRMKAMLAFLLAISLHSVAFGQGCPCSAVKLGVDTTKGMKFDTVAYRGNSQLLFDYINAKNSLLALYGLLYDSVGLDPDEVQQLTVKRYGTRTPLPYDYISFVTLTRKGSSLKKFNYKLTFVIKDGAMASDTLVFDTLHETSLARIPQDLDSLTATLAPTLKWIQNRGKSIGVDTIRGAMFDDEAYKTAPNSAALLSDYAKAKGIADQLEAFYLLQQKHTGLKVVPFGFVDGEIDLGNRVSGNGTDVLGVVKIKNNYCTMQTITMLNTTSDTIAIKKIDLGQSPYFTLDSITKLDPSKKSALPAQVPPGGALQAIIRICHGANTTLGSSEPIITDQLTVSTANNNSQMYTLQAQSVYSSYDYVASVTLDRKGKTLKTFYYKLSLLVADAVTGDTVKFDTADDVSLSVIPQDLQTMVRSFSPTLHMLRAYQAKIRDDSGDHYISLKYTILPEKMRVKSNETTDVHVKVYDCDGTAVRGKHFDIKLNDGSESTLSESQITTDNDGEATVTFTAGSKAEVAKISLDHSYTTVTHHAASIGNCGSKSIGVGAPYTLTVEGSLHVHGTKNASGNTGDFDFTGTAPMELQVSPSDTCGKWVLLDDVTFTLTGQWVTKDNNGTATCTYTGGTYTSPATFVTDCPGGTTGTLHIDHVGPLTESYACTSPKGNGNGGGSQDINTILMGAFNASKAAGAQAEGQDKIANIKALAAKAQAERAAGNPHAREDYMALMAAVKGGGGMSSGGLSALSFNFKAPVDRNGSPVFDYSPALDEVHGMEDKLTSATIHVKIEKNGD